VPPRCRVILYLCLGFKYALQAASEAAAAIFSRGDVWHRAGGDLRGKSPGMNSRATGFHDDDAVAVLIATVCVRVRVRVIKQRE